MRSATALLAALAATTAAVTPAAADAPPGGGPAEVRRQVEQATVQIGDGAHAGFLVDPGHVIGAAHCLLGEQGAVKVRFRDGLEVAGRVVVLNPGLDLAVVEVPPTHGHEPLPLAASGEALDPGELLAHAGHPQGYPWAFTLGRFVGTTRLSHRGPPLLRFATWAVGGDSGGPVVCAGGRVHGVLVAARNDGGEGYAVPVDFVRRLLGEASARRPVEPGEPGEVRTEEPRGPGAGPLPGDARAQIRRVPAERAGVPRVTLYGADWCAACRSAASWLRARGVPFEERDAGEVRRLAAERNLALGPGIPVILVESERGAVVLQGFSPPDLRRALDRLSSN